MADISIDELCQCAAVSSTRNGGMVSEDARAYFDRGMAWVQVGAYEQALGAWKQALRIAPDLAEAYAAAGSVYMTMGCWQEAARNYQKAIQADPYLLESYYGLGNAYGHLGDYGRAIDVYERALQLPPPPRPPSQEVLLVSAPPPAVDAFQDRLRADSDGFDFSALLSSPAERRQAVREESTATVPAILSDRGTRRTEVDREPMSGALTVAPGEIAPAISLASAPISTIQTAVLPEPTPWSPVVSLEPALEPAYDTHSPQPETSVSAAHAASGLADLGWNHHHITDVTLVELGAVEPDNATDNTVAPGNASARDQRARTVLVVSLIVLGCLGGRAAVSAIHEARDRDAYLAATREAQIRRGSVAPPPSSKGTQ